MGLCSCFTAQLSHQTPRPCARGAKRRPPGLKRRSACPPASLRGQRTHVGVRVPPLHAAAPGSVTCAPWRTPRAPSVCLAAAATMHGTSRTSATSVNADCCIPAGLRLGPVPGTFKLGKYLSDRREPGPKKKVLGHSGSPPLASHPPPQLPRSGKGVEGSSGRKGIPAKSADQNSPIILSMSDD